MSKKIGATRISRGEYNYKGYTILCIGYYEPDKRVVWQAINNQNGCGDFHGYTKREVMIQIDEEV